MKKLCSFGVVVLLLASAGCSKLFQNPFSGLGDDDDSKPAVVPERVIEPTSKFALAIGGVAPGRDELVIYDSNGNARDFSGQDLSCTADEDIVILKPRPDHETFAAGSGVLIVATAPGVTAIRCKANGEDLLSVYEVTIPPQDLIQILVAEAAEQLSDEGKPDEDAKSITVALSSSSPTGNALGSVIRNRINRINAKEDPSIFNADVKVFDSDPPASYYDAVILADGQFAPVDKENEAHKTFSNAQDRNFLDEDTQIAYDQAVITAAGIFNGDIADTTTGAFGFRSPTVDEWSLIRQAWSMAYIILPDGIGFSDASFPGLAPIQILIHPDVWKYSDSRPSFVFVRSRTTADFAVSMAP